MPAVIAAGTEKKIIEKILFRGAPFCAAIIEARVTNGTVIFHHERGSVIAAKLKKNRNRTIDMKRAARLQGSPPVSRHPQASDSETIQSKIDHAATGPPAPSICPSAAGHGYRIATGKSRHNVTAVTNTGRSIKTAS
jgi:hypothetical protein